MQAQTVPETEISDGVSELYVLGNVAGASNDLVGRLEIDTDFKIRRGYWSGRKYILKV